MKFAIDRVPGTLAGLESRPRAQVATSLEYKTIPVRRPSRQDDTCQFESQEVKLCLKRLILVKGPSQGYGSQNPDRTIDHCNSYNRRQTDGRTIQLNRILFLKIESRLKISILGET
jgi:hypothetical protein